MRLARVTIPVNLLIALSVSAALSTYAQSAPEPAKSYVEVRHQSRVMGREMPYRVVLPANYGEKDNSQRYPVLFLLHGLWGHFDNWTDKNDPKALVRPNVIVVTPEGANGWYVDGVGGPGERYETYFVEELIGDVESRFRTWPGRENRFIAGLSMGGYGAVKFGLKHPHLFSVVGSFSGAFDAPLRTQGNPSLNKSIVAAFGPDDSPVRKANDIFAITESVPDERRPSLPFIYMDCGTEDWLIETNREFSKLLLRRKIPHEFRQLPGGHAWTYWNRQVQEFFRLLDARMSAASGRKD